MIVIQVLGVPQPGGSKKAFPHYAMVNRLARSFMGRKWILTDDIMKTIIVTDDAKHGKQWREAVAWAGKKAMVGRQVIEGPVAVSMDFYMPRPKNHWRKKGILGKVGIDNPEHIVRPDALKLARSTEDALTGIVWKDDAQTVALEIIKHYEAKPGQVGCVIQVEEIDARDEGE